MDQTRRLDPRQPKTAQDGPRLGLHTRHILLLQECYYRVMEFVDTEWTEFKVEPISTLQSAQDICESALYLANAFSKSQGPPEPYDIKMAHDH